MENDSGGCKKIVCLVWRMGRLKQSEKISTIF